MILRISQTWQWIEREKFVKSKHNWNADDYARNSSAQQQWAEELIAKLALKGCESVIDIGCGDGKISAAIAHAVKDGYVLGIDSSENMIKRARERFPPETNPNLAFRCMDATEIHLSGKFDIAFSNAALHWVEDQKAVLRGVHACLKTGGKILFQMGGQGNAADIFVTMQEIISQPQWKGYFDNFKPPYHFQRPNQYSTWLAETGFRPLRVELIQKDMQHAGKEGVKGWLRTTWFPYTDRLPAEMREVLLEEVVETYLTQHPIDDLGNSHIGMVRLEVEAYAL